MERQIITPSGFKDDGIVPAETIICYSKKKNIRAVYVYIAIIFLAIVFIIVFEGFSFNYFFGLLAIIYSLIFGIYHYKDALNLKPQIILNANGIQTISTPFYKWEDISGEVVPRLHEGKTTGYYLVYNHPAGAEKLAIAFLATDDVELTNLMRVYRGRSHAKTENKKTAL